MELKEELSLSISIEPTDLVSECCGAKVDLDLENLGEPAICTKCNKECDWSLDTES